MAYEIINKFIPTTLYKLKAPYAMKPQYVTIHNTANDATALNEIAYMTRNTAATSYHVAIDDKHAVQAIPFSHNAWHCGDGQGNGNRKSIGIEICYSKSGGPKYYAAEENAVEYTAYVLKQYGWGIDRIKWHRDWPNSKGYRKNCPHRMIDEGRLDSFKKRVKDKLDELNGKGQTAPKPTPPKEETTVPNKPKDRPVSASHKDAWDWAKEKGLLNGERPGDPMTREQFATVLKRYDDQLNK